MEKNNPFNVVTHIDGKRIKEECNVESCTNEGTWNRGYTDMTYKEGLCPRCIEEWTDDNNVKHKGTEEPTACEECGICKDCEHLNDCSQAN